MVPLLTSRPASAFLTSAAAGAVLAVCVAAIGQTGGGLEPACYKNIERSCGAMHADESRTCGSGANQVPCGDVVINDDFVSDVRAAEPGESGNRGPIDIPCGEPVYVEVHKFACIGGVCRDQNVQPFSCQGRCATGGNCTGTIVPD